MKAINTLEQRIACKQIDIDVASFYQTILLELETLMEDVIGAEESKGFIGMVADHVGAMFHGKYKAQLGDEKMSPEVIAHVLVDLKRRIGGRFSVSTVTPDTIVLQNSLCPFGINVVGKQPLCHMTANVFGKIVSAENGYAAVELNKTIANGDGHCHVVVHLKPQDDHKDVVHEYFGVQ
jgi:predicted ArsR family transcriptional regulator